MKKALSLILATFIVLTLLPAFAVFAVEEGDGPTTSAPEAVSTAAGFAAMLPNGSYYLTADITVSATYAGTFTGTLDGKGHKVTVTVPLFEEVNGTVKDLVIEGTVSGEDAGALSSKVLGGKYEKITNKATVKATKNAGGLFGLAAVSTTPIEIVGFVNNGAIEGDKAAGGAIGNSDKGVQVNFTNCKNTGAITGKGDSTGGLFGLIQSNGSNVAKVNFKDCENNGVVDAVIDTPGGLAGYGQGYSEMTFKNCKNTGDVKRSGEGDTYPAGGILGHSSGFTTFEDCFNSGNVTNLVFHAGGIVGRVADSATFKNCVNTGNIKSDATHAGGIVAVINYDAEFTSCFNSGKVHGTKQGAGIAANIGDDKITTDCVFTYCGNTGEITTDKDTASGILAYLYGKDTAAPVFVGCFNTGNVTGGCEVSAFAGYFNSTTKAKFTACFNTGKLVCKDTSYKSCVVFYSNFTDNVPAENIKNVYYTPGTADAAHRYKGGYTDFAANITADDVASGKLCYLLNEALGKTVFRQTIGTDKAPTFDADAKEVIKNADGTFSNPKPVKPTPTGDIAASVAVVAVVALLGAAYVSKKTR